MEIIESITEVYDEQMQEISYSRGDGYKIVTNEQEIVLLIDNGQSCCEHWGYLLTEDETDKYIGAELLAIEITDINRTKNIVTKYEEDYDHSNDKIIHLDDREVIFVDIMTSEGTLQFAAYNSHNGYYGHQVEITSKELKHSVVL